MPRIFAVLAVSLVFLGVIIGVAISGAGRQTMTITETRISPTTATTTTHVVRLTTVTIDVLAEPEVSVRTICFSKTMNCASIIVDSIDRANSSVLVAIFSFTRDDIANALVRAHNRGIDVRVIIERTRINESGSEYLRLKNNGVNVRLDGNPDLMHHKFIVIDGQIVITGSYNFSGAAEDRNDENLIVIVSARVASQYTSEFERIWRAATS
ncbi:MAG: phospholipase D family protein [Thaumarchaeota archaeon]|nr:phospholipase D family protein [Candidatus Calditenuaceae archaeon]MDW8187314.1 phospholipase D family protein [Nitrososphaerota archaeon]